MEEEKLIHGFLIYLYVRVWKYFYFFYFSGIDCGMGKQEKKGKKQKKKMFLRVEKEKKFFDQKIRENLCKINNIEMFFIFITFQFNSKSF